MGKNLYLLQNYKILYTRMQNYTLLLDMVCEVFIIPLHDNMDFIYCLYA